MQKTNPSLEPAEISSYSLENTMDVIVWASVYSSITKTKTEIEPLSVEKPIDNDEQELVKSGDDNLASERSFRPRKDYENAYPTVG